MYSASFSAMNLKPVKVSSTWTPFFSAISRPMLVVTMVLRKAALAGRVPASRRAVMM